MNEDEARSWLSARFNPETIAKAARFVDLVVAENSQQNLIAPSTVGQIWSRHIIDSAQLVAFDRGELWVDIGSGGGFPGIVVALLRRDPMLLVEPRKRRADFLATCVERLALDHVQVIGRKVETLTARAGVVSARAVGSVGKLLHIARHCAKSECRWLLPRGCFSAADLSAIKQSWRGVFHVEQSITDPASSILIIDGVHPR